MVSKETKIIGSLIITLLLTGVIYIAMPDAGLKIRVDNDKSTFYVQNDNNRWIVSGREYNTLLDGTTKLYRDSNGISIEQFNDSNSVTIKRNTQYKRGPLVVDTYYFEGDVTSIELFPISHTVEIFNGTGYFYKYEVKDLDYSGETFKLDGVQTSQAFGFNMKVEWWEDYRLGWIYSNGNMYIKSEKIDTDYVKYDVRLFDPSYTLDPQGDSHVCSGDWNTLRQCTRINDSNISTYAMADQDKGAQYYVNYTMPTTNYTGNLWEIVSARSDFAGKMSVNRTIPDYCANQTQVQFKISIWNDLQFADKNINVSCWNGTVWDYFTTPVEYKQWTLVYQEQVYWYGNLTPIIILNSPSNDSYIEINNSLLNVTPSDLNTGDILTVWFYGDGVLINTTENVISGTDVTYNWTDLSDGLHNWTAIVTDGGTTNATDTRIFEVNTGSYCYQETATETSRCGGLDTGSYTVWGHEISIKYTKPVFASGAIWTYKLGDNITVNHTLSPSEFDNGVYPNEIVFDFLASTDTGKIRVIDYAGNILKIVEDDSTCTYVSPGTNETAYDGDWNTAVTPQTSGANWSTTADTCVSRIFEEGVYWTTVCTENANCSAGYYCNNNAFCVEQVGTGYECGDNITHINTDTENNGACTSAYCRFTIANISNNDKYCADSSTDCVDYDDSLPANSRNTGYQACEGDDKDYTCTNGIWGEGVACPDASCSSDVEYGDSTCVESTGCSAQATTNCDACDTCSGTTCSGYYSTHTQDTVGTNTCDSTCVECNGAGSCTNQADGDDYFSQCEIVCSGYSITPGTCSGSAACTSASACPNFLSCFTGSACFSVCYDNLYCRDASYYCVPSGLACTQNVIDLYLESLNRNITAELNSSIEVMGVGNNSHVCLDINHPDYGINYSCEDNSTSIDLNISYFRTNTLNDSSAKKNLTYASKSNQTIYISAHQYDEIENLSINLTGYENSGSYLTNVTIYINNYLDSSIGNLGIYLNAFNDGDTSKSIVYKTGGYKSFSIDLLNGSQVLNSYLNITGIIAKNISYYTYVSNEYPHQTYGGLTNAYTGFWTSNNDDIYTDTSTSWEPMDKGSPNVCRYPSEMTYTGSDYDNTVFILSSQFGFYKEHICFYNAKTEIYTGYFELNDTYVGNKWEGITWYDDTLYVLSNDVVKAIVTYNATGTELITYNLSLGFEYYSLVYESTLHQFLVFGANTTDYIFFAYNTSFDLQENWTTELSGLFNDMADAPDNNIYGSPSVNASTESAKYRITEYDYYNSVPTNPYLEIGTNDGVREWNYTGEYSTEETTNNFSSAINTYISNSCAAINNTCTIPFSFSSSTAGELIVDAINITYELDGILIELNINLAQLFLNNSINDTNIPITISSDTAGILEISNVTYNYAGGNKTYSVTAHNDNYTFNKTFNITYYYSDYESELPSNIEYIDFYPWSPTAKNVTPFGQTTNVPILNITATNYGGKNFDFYMKINKSINCANISTNTTNIDNDDYLSTTWKNISINTSYESEIDIWMWADLSCDYSYWSLWNPEFKMAACCDNCDVCSKS